MISGKPALITWCRDCAAGHDGSGCPNVAERIVDSAQATLTAASVRHDLARLGLATPEVPVQLVDALGGYQGITELEVVEGVRAVPRIMLLRGLGPVLFGRVLAHELAHALLHLTVTAPIDRRLEEGVCEMVGVVWLCQSDRPEVDGHLHQMWRDPDPLYGEPMRQAVTAARRHGMPAVLDAVCRTGRLP